MTQANQQDVSITSAVAKTVAQAAPRTPRLRPGTAKSIPSTETVRDGKIKSALKTTSSTHIATPSRLGIFILPLTRSMPVSRKLTITRGQEAITMKKYSEANPATGSRAPSQVGRSEAMARPTAASAVPHRNVTVKDWRIRDWTVLSSRAPMA